MITVNLTTEQFVAIGRLVEDARAASAAARDVSEWPDRDYHAATARLLARTTDVLTKAVMAKVAELRQKNA